MGPPAPLVPPDNFSMVWHGVYRSGFPTKKNLHFLRTVGIRSVLCLCPEDYPESSMAFFRENGISLIQHGVDGNKAPDDRVGAFMSHEIVADALASVMDPANHPLLIHCNQGKHRTGTLVGCLRKVQRWSLVAIFEEYRRFAGEKSRVVDLQFIELFDTSTLPVRPARAPSAESVEHAAAEAAATAAGADGGGSLAEQGDARRARPGASEESSSHAPLGADGRRQAQIPAAAREAVAAQL